MKAKIAALLFCCCFTSLVAAQYNVYDWKSRDRWMNVEQLLSYANLTPDNSVADVGAHEGYLTMHLSRKVGPKGKVYAVDVREDRLKQLEKHASKRKLKNITTIVGDYDDPKLPKATLDAVFVIDTYHEMSAYKEMLNHFYRSLKSQGKLVMLEKMKKHKVGKSRSEQVAAHTLALSYVKEELQAAGFKIEKEVDNFGYWERDKTKQMWILVARKP